MRIVRQKNYSNNDENKKGVSKKDVAKFAALKVGGLGALLGSYAIPSVLSDEGLKKEEELGRSHQEIAGKHSAMMEDIEDKLNVKIKPDENNLGSRWDKEKNTIFLDNKSGKTHSGLVHEAGHAEISKGIQEGIQEGREELRRELIKKLLEKNLSIEEIAEYTLVPVEQVKEYM